MINESKQTHLIFPDGGGIKQPDKLTLAIAQESEFYDKEALGKHFATMFANAGLESDSTSESFIIQAAIDSALFVGQQIGTIRNLFSKEKISKFSSSSWWLRHIAKELKEGDYPHNTLGGATGAWSLTTEIKGIYPEYFFKENNELSVFATRATEGLWSFNERMMNYLEVFWEQLVAAGLITSELKKFEDRTKPENKSLWVELLGRFGAVPEIDSNGKERMVHLRDPALAINPKTREEFTRSPEDLRSTRIIVYKKNKEGAWQHVQKIISFGGDFNMLDFAHEANDIIINLSSQDFSDGIELDDGNNERCPAYEVAFILDPETDTKTRNNLPTRFDSRGVANRAPVCRLAIDCMFSEDPINGNAIALKEISAIFPHYSANEETGRNLIRMVKRSIRQNYEKVRFSRASGETAVIRRDPPNSLEKDSLETLEVSSEIELSEEIKQLIKLANKADKHRLNNEKLRPIGFEQLVALVFSIITEQSTYICVSPEIADLQIALAAYRDGDLSSLINETSNNQTDYTEWFNKVVEIKNQPTEHTLVKELKHFIDHSRKQIQAGKLSMALPAVLETHSSDIAQRMFATVLNEASEFIKGAKAQISSVYHAEERDEDGLSFITAGSASAKIKVALVSTKEFGQKKKYVNLGYRFEKEDLEKLAGESSLQKEEEAIKFTDDLLKKQMQTRLILVSTMITILFSDEVPEDLPSLFETTMEQVL